MEEQKKKNAPLTLMEKRERRLKKYAELGQYKDGVFYCKRGKPIDDARLNQYEKLCYYMANKYCPKKALYEAALDEEDLINRCRMEVFLALLNGFDPEKAMTAKTEELRLKKLENPEESMDRAERNIVQGRLKNYFRRTLWTYHPDQYGGSSVSYEGMCDGINQEYKNDFVAKAYEPPAYSTNLEKLLTTLKNRGGPEARRQFFDLPRDDRDRVLSLLKDKGSAEVLFQESGGNFFELTD
jgi:hypothetical protein